MGFTIKSIKSDKVRCHIKENQLKYIEVVNSYSQIQQFFVKVKQLLTETQEGFKQIWWENWTELSQKQVHRFKPNK
jgi:hypothetical protein